MTHFKKSGLDVTDKGNTYFHNYLDRLSLADGDKCQSEHNPSASKAMQCVPVSDVRRISLMQSVQNKERMWVLALFALLSGVAEAQPWAEGSVPKISYNQLLRVGQERALLDLLRDDGGRVGAFAVTGIPVAGYGDRLSEMMGKARDCIGRNESLPAIDLPANSRRRTYATEDDVYPECVAREAEVVSRAFDLVGAGVSGAVEAVYGGELFYARAEGVRRRLAEAPHKDHIHFYEQRGELVHSRRNLESAPLVPEHTDNGLFLMITPFPEQSLVVRTSSGRRISTADLDPADTVLVLTGVALPDWLLQGERAAVRRAFHPVPHSVPHVGATPIGGRTVFARMKVAPGGAVPITPKTESAHRHDSDFLTFEEVFVRESRSYPLSSESSLCSVDLESERYQRAVRDQCEVEGTAYCWHDCLPIPANCTSNSEMVCLDIIELEECDPDIHNPNCELVCLEVPEETTKSPDDTICGTDASSPDDPTQSPSTDDSTRSPSQPDKVPAAELFCNGIGIDMYMQGFEVSGKGENQCIMLFFEAFTLDSPLKFGFGCVFVFLLGLVIEVLIAFRRSLTQRATASPDGLTLAWQLAILSVFALSLVLGYLAMLVAMTYSVELFLCVVAGLVVGHGVFNLGTPVGETVDPCCASQNIATKNVETAKPEVPIQPVEVEKGCCKDETKF